MPTHENKQTQTNKSNNKKEKKYKTPLFVLTWLANWKDPSRHTVSRRNEKKKKIGRLHSFTFGLFECSHVVVEIRRSRDTFGFLRS